ncbi:MAG: metallophosphoesterase [Myxococcota bacterium]|nr:metallophosphoesterase [Myxococcota bacterium]
MPLSRLLIFLAVVSTITIGGHALIAWRLGAPFSATTQRTIRILAALNALMVVGAGIGGRTLPDGSLSTAFSLLGYSCMGLFALFFASTLVADGLRLLGWAGLGAAKLTGGMELNPARRELLSGALNLGAIGVAGGLSGAALLGAQRAVAVKSVSIPVTGRAAALAGLKIVQITDIHIGPTIKGDFLADVVAKVNALKPDIIAVTGDLVDGSVAELGKHTAVLAELKARHGVYFVTGNHEYYSGAKEWNDEIRRLGLTVLMNEHELIEHDGARLLLAGVTDYTAGRMIPEHASSPLLAAEGAPDADYRVLLAHQPASAYEASEAGFELQLSGHTHGGQFFPGTALIHLAHPVAKGLGKVGNTLVYVSCGTGYWGPPFRLGAPAEITEVVLAAE